MHLIRRRATSEARHLHSAEHLIRLSFKVYSWFYHEQFFYICSRIPKQKESVSKLLMNKHKPLNIFVYSKTFGMLCKSILSNVIGLPCRWWRLMPGKKLIWLFSLPLIILSGQPGPFGFLCSLYSPQAVKCSHCLWNAKSFKPTVF